MPKYKTHNRFNLLFSMPLFIFGAYKFFSADKFELLFFSSSFIYASLFMSPDVDIAHKVKIFSIRGAFNLPFYFYSKIFRHRGVSHHVFLGTLL